MLITVGVTVLLVVGLHKGPTGARRRQLHRDALPSTSCCSATAATSSGSQFSRELLRQMNHFGMPLVPSRARAVGDQLHRPDLHRPVQGPGRGRRLLGRRADLVGDRLPDDRVPPRLAGVRVLDRGRPRGQADVLVRAHLPAVRLLLDLARARRARAVARPPARPRARASTAPPTPSRCSRFAATAYAGYTVVAIGIGRARQTQFNWVVTGAAAAVNIGLNVSLIPPYGMIGAAISTARRLPRALRRRWC